MVRGRDGDGGRGGGFPYYTRTIVFFYDNS